MVPSAGEGDLVEARALRSAHLRADLDARILDLAVYEVGNVLVRVLRWPTTDAADQLDDLITICGPPIAATPEWLRDATGLASTHALSFYDAVWAAAARGLAIPLVSADRRLLGARLAESPASVARRLRLE